MNLVADIGNTRIKIGIFENNGLLYNNSFNLEEFAEKFNELNNLNFNISAIIYSSVIDDNFFFIDFMKRYTNNIYKLSINLKLPFSIKYKTPETLGTDRIADVAGAKFFSIKIIYLL